MTVTEQVGALGSWELQLVEETPQDAVLDQLGFLGHVAIVAGPVDVESSGDALLEAARYVGVLRAKGKGNSRRLGGHGMIFWLGDEEDKGHGIEAEVTLTSRTLLQAVTDLKPPSVALGTVHAQTDPAARYTGKHNLQGRRAALTTVAEAFGAELRVNGDGTLDVGTQAQLYQGVPRTDGRPAPIIVRKPGRDLDLVALMGTLDVDETVYDYSTDVVLLGQTTGPAAFAEGRKSATSVPYVDLFGNPVKFTRFISESSETEGSVDQRATLHLNKYNRVTRALRMQASEYDSEGSFVAGDMAYVYDPETGITDPNNEVDFRGRRIWPDIARVSEMTWPVTEGHTVAFRTQAGVWIDLTPYVVWETGGGDLVVGELPQSLSRPTDDPLQLRLDAARGQTQPDDTIPGVPGNLTLTTYLLTGPQGDAQARISASWTAPTTNTDGSTPVDESYYVVHYRVLGQAQWQTTYSADTSIDLDAMVDIDYEVQVAAVDRAGNTGAFTAAETIRTSVDTIPPPAPADPVTGSYLGLGRIQYLGTDSTGALMPADTNRVDVHVGTTSGFTATAATRVDSLNPFARGVTYHDVPYGTTKYVRLIAVDHHGNPSPSSAAVALVGVKVADGDITSMSVARLTAGILTADVTIAGRFATALTGARREVNAIGFQAYNASEQLTVSIDGVTNLLAGVFKTALSGRRIEIGAGGTVGEITFYDPTGRRGVLRGFTATIGDPGSEAVQLYVPITGVASNWNAIQVDLDEEIFFNTGLVTANVGGNGTGSKGFVVKWLANRGTTSSSIPVGVTRFDVNADDTMVWSPAGNSIAHFRYDSTGSWTRFVCYSPTSAQLGVVDITGGTNSNQSARLEFGTPDLIRGGQLSWYVDHFHFANGNNSALEDIHAAAFVVGSDQATKENVSALAGDVRARLRPLAAHQYTRIGDDDPKPEIGFMAQDVPEEIRRHGEDGRPVGYDVAGLTVLNTVAIQEIDADLAKLREQLDGLLAAAGPRRTP